MAMTFLGIVHIIVLVALMLFIGVIGYEFVKDFATTTGSIWTRLLAAGKDSATILWARFSMIVAAITAALVDASDYFNAPGVSDAIKQVMQPQYVALVGLFVAIITEVARRRTLPPSS
jgi:hypothetical protein